MAEDLAPTFTYEKFNEYTESQTQECIENDCEEWTDIEKQNNFVQKLTLVDFWSGQTQFDYESYKTSWEVKEETKVTRKDGAVKTKTRIRKQKFRSTENTTSDYFTFDQILNSHDLGLNDKRLIQENFLIAGGEMNYISWLEGNAGFGGGSFPGFNGVIIPGSNIPAEYMEHYLSAEKEYGVDWFVLASLHFVETGFSTHPTMVSSVGAIGHVQFLPASWAGWKYDIGGGSVPASLDITNLSVIKGGGGYGVDANGDGKADPWDVADAIHTAANYLSKSGYSKDKRKAIFNYNRADWYVEKVMNNAQKFKDAAVYKPADGVPAYGENLMRPTQASVSSSYGMRFHPIHHEMRLHSGIDLAAVGKVPIVASADGVVARSKYNGALGHHVMIDHSINGQYVQTVYGHMRGRNVRVGQTVSQGEFLGFMGSTGSSTAQHLHFEIHVGGSYNGARSFSVDPAKYINF
ncbi:peptidase M23 (plasmid) [Halobacillus litoralis]|uniref:Peptidase M23 n=2 Tax=Halobacillus litoralis TaxID=45668 RepID=A0A410MJM8_9BACI|nr:peptidase M23 [Halobacillus litoralis]